MLLRKRKRKRQRGEKDEERNPLSAINRIKDDFPKPEETSRENSSNRVESSRVAGEVQWPVDLLNWNALIRASFDERIERRVRNKRRREKLKIRGGLSMLRFRETKRRKAYFPRRRNRFHNYCSWRVHKRRTRLFLPSYSPANMNSERNELLPNVP